MESAAKKELSNEIAEAINNAEKMTDEELVTAYQKINNAVKKLPLGERGKFAWESGLEVLTMIYLGIEYKKTLKNRN